MSCILIPCAQAIATPGIIFEFECNDTHVEIGDAFEIDVWLKNSKNESVDTWEMDISFQSEIDANLVEMSPLWCTEYHYNGTIGDCNITEIQSFNKNASNNDTLLFTIFFRAVNNGICHIDFRYVSLVYKGYHLDFNVLPTIVTVGSGEADSNQSNTTDNITENIPPTANIDCSYSGESVYFNASNSTSDKNITSYDWDFGDNTTGTGSIVTHNYIKSDNYIITLTVTDEEGLADTQTVSINVTFIPETTSGNNKEDSGWILWVVIIIIIILLVAIFLSRYDIEM